MNLPVTAKFEIDRFGRLSVRQSRATFLAHRPRPWLHSMQFTHFIIYWNRVQESMIGFGFQVCCALSVFPVSRLIKQQYRPMQQLRFCVFIAISPSAPRTMKPRTRPHFLRCTLCSLIQAQEHQKLAGDSSSSRPGSCLVCSVCPEDSSSAACVIRTWLTMAD